MKPIKLYFLLSLITIICGSAYSQQPNDVELKNKTVTKKLYKAFENGNTDNLPKYVADNYTEHSPDPNIKSTGLQGLKDAVAFHHKTFPDMKIDILHLIAEGDMVVAHVKVTGTHTGGKDPTHESMNINGTDIFRFEKGKAVEHWGYFDEPKVFEKEMSGKQ